MRQILVVDDEPIIRTFLAEGLTDAGYVVKTARNGAEALARAFLFRSDAATATAVSTRDSPVRPVGTCPICGAPSNVAELDKELSDSDPVRALHAARRLHVLSHSARDIARWPLRRQLLQLPMDRRQILAEWVYDELRRDWGDQDRRAVHSIDEVLDAPSVHRLWQDRLICTVAGCRHESRPG